MIFAAVLAAHVDAARALAALWRRQWERRDGGKPPKLKWTSAASREGDEGTVSAGPDLLAAPSTDSGAFTKTRRAGGLSNNASGTNQPAGAVASAAASGTNQPAGGVASAAGEPTKANELAPTVDLVPRDLTRRELLETGAVGSALLLGAGLGAYATFFGRHDYELEEIHVALPGLPSTLEGFTLVQLSDVHIGKFVGEWELRAAQSLVRRAKPDLIVLTGDLVDHEPQYASTLGRWVRRLKPLARHGVAAVPGNHDYYSGIDTVLSALRAAGARVLRNEGVVIGDGGGGFALLGVDDLWAGSHGHGPASTRAGGQRSDAGPNIDRAIARVPPDLPRVLLCHQPELFWGVAPKIQLQLSGHTHGGQVSLGYEPAGLMLPHGYVEGFYEKEDGVLYVNRGFGTAGPPARLGAAPEVTRIVLTSG